MHSVLEVDKKYDAKRITISVNLQQQNEEVSNRWPDFTGDDLLPQRDTPYEVSGGARN